MARTLASLFTTYTPDQCKQRILDRCTAKGLPVTDWAPGGVALTLIEAEAQENSDYSLNSSELARSAFLGSSSNDWLDLEASDVFQCPRLPATYSRFELGIRNATASPVTVVAGQIWLADPGGLRSVNEEGFTIPATTTIYTWFRAEQPGSAYRETPYTILTPIPGVSIDDYNDMTLGTDAETDASLRARCLLKWSSVGTGMNDDAYTYHAITAAGGAYCNRVKVVTSTAGDGVVTCTLAGPNGALDAGAVSYIQTILRAKAGSAITVNCVSAAATTATITASVVLRAGVITSDAYKALVYTALADLINTMTIGNTLYKAQIYGVLMNPPGVVNVVLTLPTTDLTLMSTAVLAYAQPTLNCTYI